MNDRLCAGSQPVTTTSPTPVGNQVVANKTRLLKFYRLAGEVCDLVAIAILEGPDSEQVVTVLGYRTL
jgi:hypothetical protein